MHRSPTRAGRKLPTREESTLSLARVTEISSTSTQSFEDAIRQGIARATQSLRGVTSAWVKEQEVKLQDGKVAGYQVNLVVTFVLEG